ncbi:LapA family protein [Saccharopolyspora flava]|uniref:Uncharacterized protein n=1 Tax=Saccharopolyspora flava TaxID=95161 RepID=A0A1I6PXS4_9PSEU|nr:LapA family protein [Saccharopolyspora flava]SFS44999.1 hypothetical protein SAMN05660874_01219 [Saccharopolyspora flava]
MITWLFTQVWLWSLAAFLLGAFITWLLFVRPLRRRLKAELSRPLHAQPLYDEPVYDEPVYDERYADDRHADDRYVDDRYADERYADERATAHQPAPLDLLEQPRQWEAPEDHQVDEWDRRPRPWVAPETVRSAPAETQAAETPSPETQAAGTRRLPEPEPTPEPVAETLVEPVAESEQAGDNTWFRNPEAEEARGEARPSQYPPGADDEDSGQLSGQLRSLFEPESAGGAQEPYTPPVGADATQVIPAVPREQDASAQVRGTLDEPGSSAAPLPKRTPQPRADAAHAEVPPIPESLRRHVEDGRPLPKVDENAADPAEIKLVDNPDESSPLPRRTPGAGPHPGRDAKWETPSEAPKQEAPQEPAQQGSAGQEPVQQGSTKATSGPMIKGHSASRKYHSPDSPEYDQITADVWFRTPSDAEIAGFEPWHR